MSLRTTIARLIGAVILTPDENEVVFELVDMALKGELGVVEPNLDTVPVLMDLRDMTKPRLTPAYAQEYLS